MKVSAGAAAHPELVAQSETEFVAVPWPAAGALLVAAGVARGVRTLRRRRRTGPSEQPTPVPDLAENALNGEGVPG